MRLSILCLVLELVCTCVAYGGVRIASGGANVTIVNQRRGLLGRVRRTEIVRADAFGNVSLTEIRRRGLLGRRTQINQVNVSGRGSTVIDGRRLASFRSRGRINAFGSTTFVDRFGNIFEIDVFGNARFRGSVLGRGFAGAVPLSPAPLPRVVRSCGRCCR